MLHTETVWRELPPSRGRPHRNLEDSDNSVPSKIRGSKRQYDKRKAAGLCTSFARKSRFGTYLGRQRPMEIKVRE